MILFDKPIDSNDLYEFLKRTSQMPSVAMHACFSLLILEKIGTNRYFFFKSFWNNSFVQVKEKEGFLEVFQKAQRTYHALARFAFRYRIRIAEKRVETDIFLGPIAEDQKNVIAIYHVGAKYLFTLSDLMNIANTALSNSFYLYPEPNPIKNPYNNIAFSKSNLYYLYFFMRWRHYTIPRLFELFFQANFNLLMFRLENECLLQDRCIKSHVDSMPPLTMANEIRAMLKRNRYGKRLRIHLTFPNQELINAMKPWLHLHYYSRFSMSRARKQMAKMKLSCLIKQLVIQNPQYGRRYVLQSPFSETLSYYHNKRRSNHVIEMQHHSFMNDHTNTNSEIQEFGLVDYFSDDEYENEY
jgi:hypothetical protein